MLECCSICTGVWQRPMTSGRLARSGNLCFDLAHPLNKSVALLGRLQPASACRVSASGPQHRAASSGAESPCVASRARAARAAWQNLHSSAGIAGTAGTAQSPSGGSPALCKAAANGASGDGLPLPDISSSKRRRRKKPHISTMLEAAKFQYNKFSTMFGRFLPMVMLFFLLAFTNTILDSLKDTLVITAVGGGAQVIPYLTVYAVLPMSFVFLYLYSVASEHLSRSQLFNGIVAAFMGFFVLFAFVLYPNHHILHPHQLADSVAQTLPSGLSGLVGMMRNWTFTLFFCGAELWGDVCLGLLFWGLANDITSLSDAHTMYPLFGLGANMAQAVAGCSLKLISGQGTFTSQIQCLMLLVTALTFAAAALYSSIHNQHQKQKAVEQERRERLAAARRQKQAEQLDQQQRYISVVDGAGPGASMEDEAVLMAAALLSDAPHSSARHSVPAQTRIPEAPSLSSSSFSSSSSRYSSWDVPTNGANGANGATMEASSTGSSSYQPANRSNGVSSGTNGTNGAYRVVSAVGNNKPGKPDADETVSEASTGTKKKKPSITEAFSTLAQSVPIQCLAVMSLAQGLCTSLMEFAWKSHIRLLYPTPAELTSFLGDVSTWQGLFTGCLMFVSPAMFARMGWKEVAAATPKVLLVGGAIFFSSCIAYQSWLANSSSATLAAAGPAMLQALVYGGALLYIFGRSAKFSMHKPSEEMVYISLEEEGRTKGKAAIDVVGVQAGKSGGSILQQLLLLISANSLAGSLPIMCVFYLLMANGWLQSVSRLSIFNPRYGHPDSVHPTLDTFESDSEESYAT